VEYGLNAILIDVYHQLLTGLVPSCIFSFRGVNGAAQASVVAPISGVTPMTNIHFALSAWPEDERDRKRAPARF